MIVDDFNKLAGRFTWTESGLILLANIQREIEEAGGIAKMLEIVEDECCTIIVEPKRRILNRAQKVWTPEETEFLYLNWRKAPIVELSKALKTTPHIIRKQAIEVLGFQSKLSA